MSTTPEGFGSTDVGAGTLEERLRAAEAQIAVLAAALHELDRGLQPLPTQDPDPDEVGKAARRAHDLLLAGGL